MSVYQSEEYTLSATGLSLSRKEIRRVSVALEDKGYIGFIVNDGEILIDRLGDERDSVFLGEHLNRECNLDVDFYVSQVEEYYLSIDDLDKKDIDKIETYLVDEGYNDFYDSDGCVIIDGFDSERDAEMLEGEIKEILSK